MCRVLAYLGEPVLLDELLYAPDNSLVQQTYAPQRLRLLNLAGFGVAAWDPASRGPREPYTYHTPGLPVFDANLRTLARKVRPTCVLAHVRGVRYSDASSVGVMKKSVATFRPTLVPLALLLGSSGLMVVLTISPPA